MDDLTPTRGTLRMAVDSASFPYSFVKDGRLAGLDPAIAHGFAKSRGYAIEPLIMDFGGIIAAITSGKADFMAGSVSHTPERAESVLFSEPTYRGYSAVCVLGAPAEGKGLVDSLAEGFEKTFVREGHWGLFVRGVATTLAITVSSCALGAALGFCLYLIWRGRGGDSGEILPRLCR